MINIRKLEAELWESADLLRQGSKLTSSHAAGYEANVLMEEIQKAWEELK